MYTKVNILTILFLFSKMNFGNGELPSCIVEACDRIIDPEYLTTSCCPETNEFVDFIKECKGDLLKKSACDLATCVLDRYGVLKDGIVDLGKVEEEIAIINEIDPKRSKQNALVWDYCINGDYTCFPSEDPFCPNLKFFNCAFFAYRIGCPVVYETCECKNIATDVDICGPYQKDYVEELNKDINTCYYYK